MATLLLPIGAVDVGAVVAAGAGCPDSDTFDVFSASVCVELVSSGSPPNNARYFLAIESQSTTFSMRVLGCCVKLTWEPSGDK